MTDLSFKNRTMMLPPLRELMGPSKGVSKIIRDVNRVAKSDFSVLIQGETGTGKELVARAIHHESDRAAGPFVPVDCGAIPETLFESELFGHEKGSFTGADYQKPGKFELAQGSTLFLDEISNMPLGCQAKLLRVLQEKILYRVGGTQPIGADVRVLASSNDNLETAVAAGSFRRDLLYRLNEFTVQIPPIRNRKDDIIYLANRFLDITNMELKKSVRGFSPSVEKILLTFDWPGNVRQLRSAIRRAVLLADDLITEEHLSLEPAPKPTASADPLTSAIQQIYRNGLPLKEIIRRATAAVEQEVLVRALMKTGGNKAKAARLLRIDYKTMHTKTKKYGITISEEEG